MNFKAPQVTLAIEVMTAMEREGDYYNLFIAGALKVVIHKVSSETRPFLWLLLL